MFLLTYLQCLSACFVCFMLGFLKQRHRRLLKDRAQQIVLACATFDESGKLLVSQGGLLPCQTITGQSHQRVSCCMIAFIVTAHPNRLLTANSTIRIPCFNGCTEYPVTGAASLI